MIETNELTTDLERPWTTDCTVTKVTTQYGKRGPSSMEIVFGIRGTISSYVLRVPGNELFTREKGEERLDYRRLFPEGRHIALSQKNRFTRIAIYAPEQPEEPIDEIKLPTDWFKFTSSPPRTRAKKR